VALVYDEQYGPEDIARRVAEVGRRIDQDYPDGDIVLIAVLKGAGFFVADLARAVSRPVRCEYIDVLRDGENEKVVNYHFLAPFDVADVHLIVLKDVVRSGVVESWLQNQLREEKPRSVRFACVVDHPQERKSPLRVDYVLFPAQESILVGYGMEFQGEGGNFPFIAQVRTEGEAPFEAATKPRRPAAVSRSPRNGA
jgi:hypoxanthine phosphoribosyltransferase